jgi:hypothetical protein
VLEFGPKRIHKANHYIGGTLQELFQMAVLDEQQLSDNLMKIHWIQNEINLNTNTLPEILRPRLSASNSDDVLNACLHNFIITSAQLDYFRMNPTKVLIINDLSIYLHLGNPQTILGILKNCETGLMNSYFGNYLQEDCGSNISDREKRLIQIITHRIQTYSSNDFLMAYKKELSELGLNFR